MSITALFFFLQVLFYKNVVENEEESIIIMKTTLREAETLIRKYQVQLQRSIGNVDLMTAEMISLKGDLKGMKQSHTNLKLERKRLEDETRSLQNKLDAFK
jgi:hypothetical protein